MYLVTYQDFSPNLHDSKQIFRTDSRREKERRKKETTDDLMGYTEAMKTTDQ